MSWQISLGARHPLPLLDTVINKAIDKLIVISREVFIIIAPVLLHGTAAV